MLWDMDRLSTRLRAHRRNRIVAVVALAIAAVVSLLAMWVFHLGGGGGLLVGGLLVGLLYWRLGGTDDVPPDPYEPRDIPPPSLHR